MERLSGSYSDDVVLLRRRLRADESFDIIERRLRSAGQEVTLFCIDGFVKDGEMQRVMQFLGKEKTPRSARELSLGLPYTEVDVVDDASKLVTAVLSGASVLLAPSFGASAIVIDARTYPSRSTAEPSADRAMQGSRDGFVETLVMNTALLRRRIRDPRLIVKHLGIGTESPLDIAVCYMTGVADEKIVARVFARLAEIRPKTLTLGYRSLIESLLPRGWLNPFPKVRTTERPDTAAAQVLEGSIVIVCDTTPEVIILPTSIFDYLSQADDYYFPPLTGSYLRLVRLVILLLSMVATPLWYLYLENSALLPEALTFLIPRDAGALPIMLQLLLVEVAIDGLKLASMNTPDMLSSSLSVVGALILGDFAVTVGWLCPDVILYMAFIAIATFAQQNAELSYAIKAVRIIMLVLVYFLGVWGLALGFLIFFLMLLSNRTIVGRSYLYPLIPLSPRALLRMLIRTKKHDPPPQQGE